MSPPSKSRLGLLELQEKARIIKLQAEREMLGMKSALERGCGALVKVLELLIHKIEERSFPSAEERPETIQVENYFNEHKYRLLELVQALSSRNFLGAFKVLGDYEECWPPTSLLTSDDLRQDISALL